jgi:hypothetical protein
VAVESAGAFSVFRGAPYHASCVRLRCAANIHFHPSLVNAEQLRSADRRIVHSTAEERKVKTTIFGILMILSLAIALWISCSAAQNQPSFTREELEDRRQEIVVRNMELDDVEKAKFLKLYVPYEERLLRSITLFRIWKDNT